MKGKFFLVLIITVIIGIQPVFAQSGSGGSAKQTAPGKTAKDADVVIHINLASDSEFFQALQTAGDVELVNEDSSSASAKTEKSDNKPTPAQEKSDKKPNQAQEK